MANISKSDIIKKWMQVETVLNESTIASDAFNKTPLHKGAKDNDRKEGVQNAPDEFDGQKAKMEKTGSKNDQGAENAADEFEGSDKAVDKATVNTTEEGSAGGASIATAPGSYAAKNFRSKLRATLGLSLDDKLNKPNMGVNGLK